MTDDLIAHLTDPASRGPMQHCRSWPELDKLHDDAAEEIGRLRAEVATNAREFANMREQATKHRVLADAAETWAGDWKGVPRDPSDARLLQAVWRYGGDRLEPCPECDGECGEPCAPCTVEAGCAWLDRWIADWMKRHGVTQSSDEAPIRAELARLTALVPPAIPIDPVRFRAADAARTAYLRDVDANDQIGALGAAIEAWEASAPVTDEALVEAAAKAIYDHPMPDGDALAVLIHCSDYVDGGVPMPEQLKQTMDICACIARAVLAAARPMIAARERERIIEQIRLAAVEHEDAAQKNSDLEYIGDALARANALRRFMLQIQPTAIRNGGTNAG